MKNIIFSTIILFLVAALIPINVFAQIPAPRLSNPRSSTQSATTSARVATASAKLASPRNFVTGVLVAIDGTTLVIKISPAGLKEPERTISVATNEKTKFFSIPKGKRTSLSDLDNGDRLAVTGISGKDSQGTALLVFQLEPRPPRGVNLLGRIKAVGEDSFTLDSIILKKAGEWEIRVTENTRIIKKGERIGIEDLQVGDPVLVIGLATRENSLDAKLVIVLSSEFLKAKISGGILKKPPVATPPAGRGKEATRAATIGSCLDLNGDNKVTIADISEVAKRGPSKAGDSLYNEKYDVNSNGVIDKEDVKAVAAQWNNACTSPPSE